MLSKTKSGERLYKCTHCDYSDTSLHTFTDHMLTHSKVYPHACGQCSMRYATNIQLSRHVQQGHNAPTISIDPKASSSLPSPWGAAVMDCPKCDYQTKRCDALIFHATQHIAMYKYTCTICFLNFHRVDHLTRHINDQHPSSLLSPEACENKDWRAAVRDLYKDVPKFVKYDDGIQSSPMANSPSVHQSSQRFITKSNYISNGSNGKKSSVGNAWCSQCKLSFNNRIKLFWHNKKVHGKIVVKRDFKCKICKFDFTTRGSLKRHMLNRHAESEVRTAQEVPFRSDTNSYSMERSQELMIDQVFSTNVLS